MTPAKPPKPVPIASAFTALVRVPKPLEMTLARTSARKSVAIANTIAITIAAFIGSDNGIAALRRFIVSFGGI